MFKSVFTNKKLKPYITVKVLLIKKKKKRKTQKSYAYKYIAYKTCTI